MNLTNSFMSDRFIQEQRRMKLFKEMKEVSKRTRRNIRLRRAMYDPHLRDILGFPVHHGFAYGNEYEQEKILVRCMDEIERLNQIIADNKIDELVSKCNELERELEKQKKRSIWSYLFSMDGTDTDGLEIV